MGLLHIYCGDGKGKTTASIGLAVRAAGNNMKVLFVQFFKDGTSCEFNSLKNIPQITCMHAPKCFGLFKNMSEEEKKESKLMYSSMLESAFENYEKYDLIVLDESISACNHKMIDEDRLLALIHKAIGTTEIVLTGRKPSEKLIEAADYVSEVHKIKHPFDTGITARVGIEF